MEWYGPLTILPAVALIIMSTTNFIIALNEEIILLQNEKEKLKVIIELKVKQLRRLGIANGILYGSALLFLIAGISKVLTKIDYLFNYILLLGVVFVAIALTFLFIHAIKSVSIREKHLKY